MKLSKVDHHLPQTGGCPWCGHPCDGASGLDYDKPPKPGDVTMCINCASVCVYRHDMTLERCPDSIWTQFAEPTPTTLRTMRRAVLLMHSQPKAKTKKRAAKKAAPGDAP